ncbi:MAG: 30S ribosomal protein S18 [Candidatus Omnitrophica bacterium]|nr:30S ribosomal protein S18 [Candidatus Omnitrophota bacterium]
MIRRSSSFQTKSPNQPRGGERKSFRPGSRPGGFGEERGGRPFRKKINRFYTVFTERTSEIDYKDTEKLNRFLTEKGKIIPRRITGFTAKQQRMLASAIKRARHAGLLAFQAE